MAIIIDFEQARRTLLAIRRARRARKIGAIAAILVWILIWVYLGLSFLIIWNDRGYALVCLLVMVYGLRDLVFPRVLKYTTPPDEPPPRHVA